MASEYQALTADGAVIYTDADPEVLRHLAEAYAKVHAPCRVRLIDPDGQLINTIEVTHGRRGYQFNRVQCITRVHPDDRALVQAYATRLNTARQLLAGDDHE